MSVQIPPVPFDRFRAFHKSFDGEANGMWEICAQCAGRCEQHKIGTLMPGEKEYIAAQMHMPVATFESRYLDCVVTPRGAVDVLKLYPGCPFLDSCFHCTLSDSQVKPVLCEIYPVVFEVDVQEDGGESPQLNVRFQIDEIDCPLMHISYQWASHHVNNPRWEEYRRYYQTRGVDLIQQVGAPAEWYWIVAQYDSENFDYHALNRLRKVSATEYGEFTLAELMSCRLGSA